MQEFHFDFIFITLSHQDKNFDRLYVKSLKNVLTKF